MQVIIQIRHPESGQARLPGTEEVTGAPKLQILLGNLEAVGGFAESFQPLDGLLIPVVGGQDTVAFRLAPAHPAPKLMKLGKTEPVRVLNDHQCGVGHVHTYLNNRGGHHHIRLSPGEGCHSFFLFSALHLPMEQGNAKVRKYGFLQGFRPNSGSFYP